MSPKILCWPSTTATNRWVWNGKLPVASACKHLHGYISRRPSSPIQFHSTWAPTPTAIIITSNSQLSKSPTISWTLPWSIKTKHSTTVYIANQAMPQPTGHPKFQASWERYTELCGNQPILSPTKITEIYLKAGLRVSFKLQSTVSTTKETRKRIKLIPENLFEERKKVFIKLPYWIFLLSKFSAPTIAFLAFWLAKKLRLWANIRSFTSYGKSF